MQSYVYLKFRCNTEFRVRSLLCPSLKLLEGSEDEGGGGDDDDEKGEEGGDLRGTLIKDS